MWHEVRERLKAGVELLMGIVLLGVGSAAALAAILAWVTRTVR